MYLKSLKITNFRKFGLNNNIVEFVGAKDISLKSDKINIAPSTTLIVGKNNSGKTTITKALNKLVIENKFSASDFNFVYLNNLLIDYCNNNFKYFPCLEFEVQVGVDFSSSCDLVTNIAPFINISSIKDSDNEGYLVIIIKYELKETTKFKDEVIKVITKYREKPILFKKFLDVIDNPSDFKLNYYSSDGTAMSENKFKLSDLINIEIIKANKIISDDSLSKTFNEIINFKYKHETRNHISDSVDNHIDEINNDITTKVSASHTAYINKALSKIESSDRLEVKLTAELTFDKIMNNIIKYEYTEGKYHIPQGQFGLGYSNLMTIIGKLIDYIERYPKQECHSKINLICIEEPEAFMHSQMQELFIKHINDAIDYLVNDMQKEINSQLIITTHSSHILNSKIHTGNSFDSISYITSIDNFSNVINLNDKNVIEGKKPSYSLSGIGTCQTPTDIKVKLNNDLKFLKKHIKYKVSELFFSDAIIFVEGVTEETLLSYHIDMNEDLNKYYISIFNINGAHGLVYLPLIKLLKVPTLIITDFDIQRTTEEKNEFTQIDSLAKRKTTNETIACFNQNDYNIGCIKDYFEDFNIYVVFQREAIDGYYATSFEEAYILSNYDNTILNIALCKTKPDIYKDIIGINFDKKNLKLQSYKLQQKLSNSKSNFANNLLYEIIICDKPGNLPDIPKYIDDGIKWMKNAVQKQLRGSEEQ